MPSVEDLLGYTLKEWNALKPEELEKVLSPFFFVTRPIQGKSAPPGQLNTGAAKSKSYGESKRLANQLKELMKLGMPPSTK